MALMEVKCSGPRCGHTAKVIDSVSAVWHEHKKTRKIYDMKPTKK